MFEKKKFYSNGKLLITGEYLVLDGALALALPTKFGQNLVVENGFNKEISWKSYDADGSIWFDDVILFSDITTKKTFENNSIKTTLIEILYESYQLNNGFVDDSEGYIVSTNLNFPKLWGLGTSSTLINNIAQWLNIDAFVLLNKAFGGSGYDIACAQNNSAILYQLENEKPKVQVVNFDPIFKNNIYFVYLNQKQDSKQGIAKYRSKKLQLQDSIYIINKITNTIFSTDDYTIFTDGIEKHENELSTVLETPTVKQTLFGDFAGSIKSLGAWGGDFVMVVSEKNPTDYFKKKGFNIVLRYDEIIL